MGHRVPMAGVWACGALTLAASCSSTSQSVNIERVDNLVTCVEEVHVRADLAKTAVYEAILRLRPVVTPAEGDPLELFEGFLVALDEAEAKAESLGSALAPMERAADGVFERWEEDLETFSSESIRMRSRERLVAARERYREVESATQESLTYYEELNEGLRDIALFLSHDFSQDAVEAIVEDAVGLRTLARDLGLGLDRAMIASEAYIASADPTGVAIQIEVAPEELPTDESSPEPGRQQATRFQAHN